MSEENVELTRRAINAFNEPDTEAFIALCDPSVDVHSVFAAVGGGFYHGHDGVRQWRRDLEESWGGTFRIQPEAFFDFGDQTLVFYVIHARGPQSEVQVAMPAALVATWRDGLLERQKVYLHRADALRDLGAAEDDLRPITP